jgi:hypothetical protein
MSREAVQNNAGRSTVVSSTVSRGASRSWCRLMQSYMLTTSHSHPRGM